MNSKDRILAALDRKQPDRVPVFDVINEPVLTRMAELLNVESGGRSRSRFPSEERLCRVAVAAGLDAARAAPQADLEDLGGGRVRDTFGITWVLSEHGEAIVVDGPVHETADLSGYDMASRLRPEHFEPVQIVREGLGADRALFLTMSDPFRMAWAVCGSMTELLVGLRLNPALVNGLMRVTTDYYLAMMEMAVSLGITVEAVFMGGDLADERTTLISPKHYRTFVKPFQKEIVDAAHRFGWRIIKHTDGNVWPILDDFIEVGFDAFHPVQPQCMDIGEVKRHLAGKMCVMGNIDCRDLLPFGTEQEVIAAVKETIAVAAPGGGYILNSSNTIHPGCKPENALAMIRAAHEFGSYV